MNWLLDNVTNIHQFLAIVAGTGITLTGLLALTFNHLTKD